MELPLHPLVSLSLLHGVCVMTNWAVGRGLG